MAYCTQADIESVYGTDNVAKWSQLDNDVATADTTRIAAAIAWADDWVNSRMRGGRYAIPLSGATVTIKDWSARMAGWWLYRSRGFLDDNVEAQMEQHKLDVIGEIANVLMGVTEIDAADSGTIATSPHWM